MRDGVDFIGVSVVFLCHDGQRNILLGKRSQNCRDEQGCWDLGGGKIEFGESFEAAVRREVREEYGCEIIKFNGAIPAQTAIRNNNGTQTHWIFHPFVVQVNATEVKNNDPEKIDEIGWFTPNTLPEPLHSELKKHGKMILEYFAEITSQNPNNS